MIYKELPLNWEDLQKKVAQIFLDAGFSNIEIEKEIEGARGKTEVDVYVTDDNGFLYICECKNWNKPVPKSVVQTFRTIINDVGANKGYLISKKGFQAGAYPIVENTNVSLVNWYEFQLEMEDAWISSVGSYLFKYVNPLFRFTDILVPKSLIAHLNGEDEKYFWELYHNYRYIWYMTHDFYPNIGLSNKKEIADLCRRNFAFPLELNIPMSTEKIMIEDLNSLRNYIIKYTDEGLVKLRNLTSKL